MTVKKTVNPSTSNVKAANVVPKKVATQGSASVQKGARAGQVDAAIQEGFGKIQGGLRNFAGAAGRAAILTPASLVALAQSNPDVARAKLAEQFNAYTAHATMNSAGKIVSNAEPSTEQLVDLVAALHGEGLTHIYRNLAEPGHISGGFRAMLEDRSTVKVDLAVNQIVKRGERLAADRVVDFEIPTIAEGDEETVDDDAFWAMYDARIDASPIAETVFNEISDQLLLGNLDKAGMLA